MKRTATQLTADTSADRQSLTSSLMMLKRRITGSEQLEILTRAIEASNNVTALLMDRAKEEGIVVVIESIKNHNFDNGNYVIEEGVEVSFDGESFKYELPHEVITLNSLEELTEYL